MFCRFPSLTVCGGLLLFFTGFPCFAGNRLNDFLDLPPVMAKQFGNPVIIVKAGKTPALRPKTSAKKTYLLRVPEGSTSGASVRRILAAEILRDFYRKNLSLHALSVNELRLRVREIIPMNEEIFLHTGIPRLLGRQTGDRVLDAWWKVRMGLPLRPDRTNQLVIVNLHWERPPGKKTTLGHFCFGIRRRGGDPDGDILFDFRAPWPYHRKPRFTEAVNIHNRLKLEIMTFNFYDWLYTQTEYRNCYVNLWFVPVYQEQLILLHQYAEQKNHPNAGNFRVGKKNCASLGAHYLDRILPIGEGIEKRNGPYDFPVHTGQIVVKRFTNKAHFVKVPNITKKLRTPTAKSELHPALPSRRGSIPFRFLLKDPAIN